MPFIHSQPGRRTNEELFFDYYSRLVGWAAQLTRNDRAEAEDLVHDFYLRITRITRSVDEIEQLEHYLFRVLRNLYYARLRRAGRDPLNDLSIVDYDSVEQGLAAADRREVLFVRDHLREVCRYACERKSNVRSASVLILRFFLGYYPTEVMKILQAGRSSVDKLLQVARNEARLFLQRPEAIRCISPAGKPPASFRVRGDSTQQLFAELQEAIFNTTEGECIDQAGLERRYAADSEQSGLTTQELSHLVSCRTCLDRVNTILHLPLLADRSPEDGIDRDSASGPGGESGAAKLGIRKKSMRKGPSIRKLERRARELYEHRPNSLQVVVDGDVRTLQKVTAEVNELCLKLARKEEPSFIEVLSEQGFCLAFLQVTEPVSADKLEQVESALFSDDRSLVLTLSFAAEGPIVHVLYRDPVMVAESELDLVDAVESAVKPEMLTTQSAPAKTKIIQLPRRFWRRIRRILPLNMNPLLASAMLFGLCSIICFLLWTRSGPRISAGTMLNRAEQSDASISSVARSEVIYQKVRITGSGHAVERAIYRDPQKKRRPKQQRLNPDDQWLKDKLNMAGVNWDEPLSAANYTEWHDRLPMKHDVVTRTGNNLLTLTTSTDASGSVFKESLTVRQSDFHPVERKIELRDVGEVEVAELNYDVMPWGVVNQDWFEPLTGQAVSDVPRIHAAIHLPHVLSDLELDEAELAARTILNQLHADTGESIHLTRNAAGIDIKGVVDTDVRKHELLSHLASLPNVHSSILSEEEVATRPPSQSTVDGGQPIEVHSVEAQPSPLEQYLREKKLPTDQLAAISHDLLDGSLRISQVEVHFSELRPRFKEVNQLPIEMQSQLATLSHTYLGTIEAGLDANNHTLLSLGFNNANQVTTTPESSDPDGDIDEQIRQYRQLCLELIMNGTAQSRPAPAIAEELINTSERIRRHLARMSATVPGNPN